MARCLCRIALFLCAFAGLAWAHAVGLSRGEYERTPQGVHANLVFAAPDVAFATRASLSEHALSVSQRGKDCLATRSTADATNDGGVQLRASFACPRTDQPVSVSLDFLSLMGPGHRHHAALRQGALESESIHVAPNAKLELGALTSPNHNSNSWRDFVTMGMEHILSGADHVAFLLALLLSTWNLKALFKVVTAFTLGHSLSLALVALGVWAPSARWVECAIALSIVYVALENLRKRRGRRPELVSLAFGLVHGMGFAGALTELNLSARQIPAVLVLFNAGVELGQLLLLALVVPLLAQARKKTWYVQRAEPVGSLALLACGFVWFLARLS